MFIYCLISFIHKGTVSVLQVPYFPQISTKLFDQFTDVLHSPESMGKDRCSDISENDIVQLEFMCKYRFSWHTCQVSLSSTGLGLVVQYGDDDLKETIADKEGVVERIRVRSTPLQGDDCSLIQQGDIVLAAKNSPVDGTFCDGRVEKAIRVRHSKRLKCNCSFTIKWLHQDVEEDKLTVLGSAIMKLATKKIDLHPTISTFFTMLESSSATDTWPFASDVDVVDRELDINVLLGRQIEEINNSTVVSGKKKSQNFVFGFKVDLDGLSSDREVDSSMENPCIVPLFNNLKGSPGSGNIQPMETTLANSPLNPLAARAALASLRSESAQLSHQINMMKEDITSKQSATKLQSERKCSFSTFGHSSVPDDFSIKKQGALNGKRSSYDGIVKTLFPSQSKVSVKKTVHPSGTRLTRARALENSENHESTQITDTKEIQLRSSSKTRGATRSTLDVPDKIELEKDNRKLVSSSLLSETRLTRALALRNSEKHESTQITDTKEIQLRSSSRTRGAARSTLDAADKIELEKDNRKFVSSSLHNETSPPYAEIKKILLETEEVVIKVDSQTGTFEDDVQKHFNSKRLTRSAAQQEAEKCISQPKQKLSKIKYSETDKLSLSDGNVTLEINKNMGKSPPVKSTPKISETVISSNHGIKRRSASLIKGETRSSPRLKLLPRTR